MDDRCFQEKNKFEIHVSSLVCEFIKMSCVLMVTFSEGNGLAEVEEGDKGYPCMR